MDYDLANYAQQMTPDDRQAMMASMLRARALQAVQEKLAAAHRQGHSFDDMAALAPMMNNAPLQASAMSLQKNAQARSKPIQLGNTGFMLPETGEFVDSPMYTEEKANDRASREDIAKGRLEATRAALEARREQQDRDLEYRKDRDEQNRILRQAIAAMANDRARLGQDIRLGQQEQVQVQRVANFADKKQLPRLMTNARQLLDIMNKYGDQEVPGLTTSDQVAMRLPFGDRRLSDEAKAVQTSYQGIINALTRADAGLSQTQGEVLRQALEQFSNPTASASTRATALRKHILPLLETTRQSVLGSAPKPILDKYRENQDAIGGDASWMDALDYNLPKKADAGDGEFKIISKRPKTK